MVSTRSALQEIGGNADESMGVRDPAHAVSLRRPSAARLSPKDVGRVPLRTFGQVDIELVAPDPRQPRKEFNPEDTATRRGIREKGQFHPIRVRWDAPTKVGHHHRRTPLAATRRRATAIDCYFVENEIATRKSLNSSSSNLLREDLKPVEEARAFVSLMELHGWNGKQVAEALRLPASKVSRALALLKLPDDSTASRRRAIPTRSA